MASYLSFGVTSSAAALRYLTDVDVIYVYHPPTTSYLAAALLRLIRRIPSILHVQDLWPESVTASAMTPNGLAGSALARALAATMTRIYRGAGEIVVISDGMAESVIERGADPSRVRTVLNWTDESEFVPVPASEAARAAIGHRGRCTVMFAGNIGPLQSVDTAIRAAVEAQSYIDLVLIGSGTAEPAARRLAAGFGATNIRFLGRLPSSRMASLYAAADYQLITLRGLPGLQGTVPSKLQAAFATGSPVIVSATGDTARLVESADAGLSCPADDWRSLADLFTRAAATSEDDRAAAGRRARRFYEERMSLRAGTDQIEEILLKLGGGRAR
jgi:colanic acid biosynthesis glycosyl transferase WcaI